MDDARKPRTAAVDSGNLDPNLWNLGSVEFGLPPGVEVLGQWSDRLFWMSFPAEAFPPCRVYGIRRQSGHVPSAVLNPW